MRSHPATITPLGRSLTTDVAVPSVIPPFALGLVAGIRLHFLDVLLHLKYRGPNVIAYHAPFRKSEEMGWFQHGSTIIVFAPDAFTLCENVREEASFAWDSR